MKENKTNKKKGYIKPEISILNVPEENHLLAGSPNVRPGQGGQGGQQGSINVIPGTEEVGDDGDILEG